MQIRALLGANRFGRHQLTYAFAGVGDLRNLRREDVCHSRPRLRVKLNGAEKTLHFTTQHDGECGHVLTWQQSSMSRRNSGGQRPSGPTHAARRLTTLIDNHNDRRNGRGKKDVPKGKGTAQQHCDVPQLNGGASVGLCAVQRFRICLKLAATYHTEGNGENGETFERWLVSRRCQRTERNGSAPSTPSSCHRVTP